MNFLISTREFWRQKGQLWLYVLSLVFSLGVFLSLDSVQVNVNNYINQEKQNIVGGDIEISSNRAFSTDLQSAITDLKTDYEVVDTYEFSSMISTDDQAILSQIKVVSPAYPLYGEVELASGENFSKQLKPGQIVVESALLTRLNLGIGDKIRLGKASLTVVDSIITEPDQSLNLFGFGPRVLVSSLDLESIDLVSDKSRVSYKSLIKISDPETLNSVLSTLKNLIEKPEKVESLTEAETTLSQFSNRFLLFLKLVIFSLLILTGIGIISILKAFLQSQRTIIAIRKSLGETPRQVLLSYLKTFSLWAVVGLVGAIGVAEGMLLVGQNVLAPILPMNIKLGLSVISIIKSMLLGMGTTLLFATYTLEQATQSTPATLFRATDTGAKKGFRSQWTWLFLAVVVYGLFIAFELENLLWSGIFLGGIIGLFLLFWSAAVLFLRLISKLDHLFSYRVRLMLRSLQRPGSATGLFLGIFTLSLTLLFSLIVMEHAIQKQFVLSYPENAPNVFLLDIKRDQVEDLTEFFPQSLDFYPVIRGPILSVNDKSLEEMKVQSGEFTRSFNLTYYEELLDTEKFIRNTEASQLFATVEDGFVPVSVMDNIAADFKIGLGDRIVFNIQGVEIAAQVTSLRTRRDATSPTPFFYFVFQPEVLGKAPQTLFATGRVDVKNIGQLQADLSKKFPQISVLDTSTISQKIGDILSQLSGITRFFTLFNLFIGFIIFIASLMATSEDRKSEAVFYRLQGMTLQNVWRVVNYEFAFIGLFATGMAIGFAALVGNLILYYLFDLSLSSLPLSLYFYAFGMLLSIFGFGLVILYQPLKTQPIVFIRENTRE